MTIRRPRLTVRRLMAAVALVGVLLGLWAEARRLRRLAEAHEERALLVQLNARFLYEPGSRMTRADWEARRRAVDRLLRNPELMGLALPPDEMVRLLDCPPPPEVCRAMLRYLREREREYRRAARAPWSPIAPAPTAPPDPAWTPPG